MRHWILIAAMVGSRVVYIFTTNRRLKEIDPAIRRPGRIDVVIEFPRPTADLRKLWFERALCAEIKAALDLRYAVAETEGMTFAEIEELRTLLVMLTSEVGISQRPLCSSPEPPLAETDWFAAPSMSRVVVPP